MEELTKLVEQIGKNSIDNDKALLQVIETLIDQHKELASAVATQATVIYTLQNEVEALKQLHEADTRH